MDLDRYITSHPVNLKLIWLKQPISNVSDGLLAEMNKKSIFTLFYYIRIIFGVYQRFFSGKPKKQLLTMLDLYYSFV